MRTTLFGATVALLLFGPAAYAGRGGGADDIRDALASGSAESFKAAVERAELLVCGACVSVARPAIDHPDAKARRAFGWFVAKRGERPAIIAEMVARLAGTDPDSAWHAADVLGGIHDASALPALSNYLANPLSEASGRAVAKAIGDLYTSAGAVPLKAALRSPLAGVRVAALEAMQELMPTPGTSRVADASEITPSLGDGDAGVRLAAVYLLGVLRDPNAVNGLADVVTHDPSSSVRRGAAWALGHIGIGSADARLALTQAAGDVNQNVATIAAAALKNLSH